MSVSVIIPNYNGRKYLKACLDSLSRQIFAAFDIVVVDNGSTDDSSEVLERDYCKVKLIKLDRNYGFSKAVNEGIKSCKSEYIVLLNNDVEVEPDWLSNLLNCIEKDKNVYNKKETFAYEIFRFSDAVSVHATDVKYKTRNV